MDNIYETPEPAPNESGVILNPIAIDYLLKTSKWAKFLAILGFIASGFMALAALFIGSIFGMINKFGSNPAPVAIGPSISILYLILAAIIFILHLFLYQFSTRTQTALELQDNELLDGGIYRLQSYFKMLGIIMIVYLSIMALVLLVAISAGLMMHH